MRAAAIRIEIHIPTAESLKEKRAKLRPVIEGIRRLGSYSVAEVDNQEFWQRATLGVAVVTRDSRSLDAALTALHRYLDSRLEIEVVDVQEYQLEERE